MNNIYPCKVFLKKRLNMTKVTCWLWGNGSLGAYLAGVVYYNENKPPDFKIFWNSLFLLKNTQIIR
jgi:hypothetical protein